MNVTAVKAVRHWWLFGWMIAVLASAPPTHAQVPSSGSASRDVVPPRIQEMVGTWEVTQRMWTAAGASPIDLPPALARRRVIEGAFLEEIMTLAPGIQTEPFTRVAYVAYNTVHQQLEYFSIDSRAPQMMRGTSYDADIAANLRNQREIVLYGENFVASQWGDSKNAAFRYRLVLGGLDGQQQTVRLYCARGVE